MTKSILPPKSNTVFQLLFGDTRNIAILADFLQSVLDVPIVFYDSSLISGQIGVDNKYETLKRVISILITDYELIAESSLYHHRFTLYDHRAAVEFTDLLEIRTLELPKIPKEPDVYLWHWMRFFRAETKEELDMVATASPAIQKATARVLKLSKDERARLIHEAEVKAWRDEQARLDYAIETGIAEGEARGEARLRSIARNMLELGLPAETISKATGYSFDEIKKLAQ